MLHGSLLINHHHTILEYQITNEGQGIEDSDCDVYAFTVFGTEKSGRSFSYHWEQEVERSSRTTAALLVSLAMLGVHERWTKRD